MHLDQFLEKFARSHPQTRYHLIMSNTLSLEELRTLPQIARTYGIELSRYETRLISDLIDKKTGISPPSFRWTDAVGMLMIIMILLTSGGYLFFYLQGDSLSKALIKLDEIPLQIK